MVYIHNTWPGGGGGGGRLECRRGKINEVGHPASRVENLSGLTHKLKMGNFLNCPKIKYIP